MLISIGKAENVRVTKLIKKQEKDFLSVWTEVDKVYETRWDCKRMQLAAA